MKRSTCKSTGPRRAGAPAFTLVEMVVASGVFMLVVGAMVAVQLFGLRVYTIAATKLSATAGCRKAMNQVRDTVRGGKTLNVGIINNADPTTFNSLGLTNNQIGNALLIYPTTNTNTYVYFYLNSTNTTNCTLMEFSVLSNAANTILITNTFTLAGYITNQDIFAAQDYRGNILTNEDQTDNALESIPNRLVIYMKLQFYQWEYPIAVVGTNTGFGNMYDFYQLRTRITRRAWN